MIKQAARVFIVTIILVLGFLSVSAPGCSQNTDFEINPAPIHEVKVSLAKSNPPQIIVYIKGGLPDGCTTFNELKTNRSDTTVTISVTNRHTRDTACPAIYGYFEQTVNLGSNFIRGQIYELKVNDYVTTFEYPI